MYKFSNLLIEFSPDGSKLLFLWNPGIGNSCTIALTDLNLNVLKADEVEIKGADDLRVGNGFLDSDHTYFVTLNGFQASKKASYIISGSVTLASSARLVEDTELRVTISHVFPSSESGKLKLCGAGTVTTGVTTAAIYQELSKVDLRTLKTVRQNIPEPLIEKFDKDGFAVTKKIRFGVHNLWTFNSVVLDEGTVVMAGDLVRVQSTGAAASAYTTVNGSVLIAFFDVSGNIRFDRLAKLERTVNDDSNLFYLHKLKNKAIIVYLDVRENLHVSNDAAEANFLFTKKELALAAAIIDNKGTMLRKDITPQIPGGIDFRPGGMQRINDNTAIMGIQKGRLVSTAGKVNYDFFKFRFTE